MKFTVGYQANQALKEEVFKNLSFISDIYFPWENFTTGRGVAMGKDAQNILERDLADYSAAGLGMNLLLNGNCYGRHSQSREFFQSIGDNVFSIEKRFGLNAITTTSPLIAKFIKTNFPKIELRASINMEIGTTEGMDYLADTFDSFYLKREYNFSQERMEICYAWCKKNGKKMYILANSGCLNFCSARSFHDNLVAHQHEIAEMDNAFDFHGVCHQFLKSEEKRAQLLRHCNFIRPEDTHRYENFCDGMKIATRTNRNPSAVLNAYCKRRYVGNLLDLSEPSHAQNLYPSILANDRIPAEYAEFRLRCTKKCDTCKHCDKIQAEATLNLEQ